MNAVRLAAATLFVVGLATTTHADPCGMVPPVTVGDDVPLARIGIQKTYVFHHEGIETIVIRPGFRGKVEEFGMLIPFPNVPAIRKVSDNVFPHVAAAVDPPEYVLDLRPRPAMMAFGGGGGIGGSGAIPKSARGMKLERDEVRVVNEEAVGMYEVAVLQAGSPAALKKWMDDHGYRYPDGMEAACEDYVEEEWCFVAVRTRVAAKSNVDPRPGMRDVQDRLPKGSTFDGHVQAMGFRFPSDRAVVPMRLSTFNEGDLRNVVYVLTDQPAGLQSIPREYVVRQLPGEELLRNVTEPLPMRILGGTVKDVPARLRESIRRNRDPEPKNGVARDLFAADLLAVSEGRLVHPHEETEKMLLRIGERLDLRGPEIDGLHEELLETEREAAVGKSIQGLRGLTLSIVDGNFPREILANQNLQFSRYRMAARRNAPEHYDATLFGPRKKRTRRQDGTLFRGRLGAVERDQPLDPRSVADVDETPARSNTPWSLGSLAFAGTIGLAAVWRRRGRRK